MLFLIFQYILLPTARKISQNCIPHTNKYSNPKRGYLLNNFIILMTRKIQLTKEQIIFILVEYEATKNCNKLEEHLMKHSRKGICPIRRLYIAQLENSMKIEVSSAETNKLRKENNSNNTKYHSNCPANDY